MGEYECVDCNAVFHLEEPPFDGFSLCNDCRTVVKFPEPLSDIDRQFLELERQRELIREQARQLASVHKPK